MRAFRGSLALTIAVLVVLGGALGALNYFQGPKLTSGAIDTSLSVSQAGQQLRLFSNEALATVKPSQILVTPDSPFTVSTSGQILALQFTHRLQYATHYTVRVSGVTSVYQSQAGAFSYGFTTAAASIVYLQRAQPASGGADQIFRTGLSGSAKTLLYSGTRIEEFAVFPAAVAVVAAAADGSSTLSLESLGDLKTDPILLPSTGIINNLQANSAAGLLAFEFTSSDGTYDHALMAVDLTAAHTAIPVLTASKQPLSVARWHFVGGTTSVVAQPLQGAAITVDLSVPGGRSAAGVAAGGAVGAALDSLADPDIHIAASPKALVYGTGAAQRTFYAAPPGAELGDFTVSPNGQYVALTVTPDAATSTSDGYPVDPQSSSVTTVFIAVATGLTVRSVTGFAAAW
jgi:hypothetical protein